MCWRSMHAMRSRNPTHLNVKDFDLVIAAHALSVGAVLVTNVRAFEQITDLQREDWTNEVPFRA